MAKVKVEENLTMFGFDPYGANGDWWSRVVQEEDFAVDFFIENRELFILVDYQVDGDHCFRNKVVKIPEGFIRLIKSNLTEVE